MKKNQSNVTRRKCSMPSLHLYYFYREFILVSSSGRIKISFPIINENDVSPQNCRHAYSLQTISKRINFMGIHSSYSSASWSIGISRMPLTKLLDNVISLLSIHFPTKCHYFSLLFQFSKCPSSKYLMWTAMSFLYLNRSIQF